MSAPEFITVPLKVYADPLIGHAGKLLYGRLKLYAGKDGRAYPKHDTLGAELGLSNRQVRYVLMELRAGGWIDWTRTRTSCVYTVFPDRQKTADQARQDIADLVAENCRSRSAENCRQKRSIENHHQNRGTEKPPVPEQGKTVFKSQVADDDEKPAKTYASPEAELKAIYRDKTSSEISPDVERRIWESVELSECPRDKFVEALRPHVPNNWKNPGGFLTSFARRIRSIRKPEPSPAESSIPDDPPKNEHGRCSACGGIGYKHWDEDPAAREYCACQLGRDLKEADSRRKPQPEVVAVFDAETVHEMAVQP
jgi:hypothetical protein